MTKHTFTLPIPPSVNQMYQPVKLSRTSSGRKMGIAHTDKAKDYKFMATLSIRNDCAFKPATRAESGKLADLPPVHVTVHLYPKTHGRRDVDGIAKMLLDAIQDSRMIYDDCQVNCLLIKKCKPDKANPRIEVEVIIYD